MPSLRLSYSRILAAVLLGGPIACYVHENRDPAMAATVGAETGNDTDGASASGGRASQGASATTEPMDDTIAQTGSSETDDATSSWDASGTTAGQDESTGSQCTSCSRCIGTASLTEFERTLMDLPADTWFEAPNSHLREQCPSPSPSGDCGAVVAAASGGAYDAEHERMLIWGGGHADYSGNELYAFDIPSATWSRLTEPSRLPDGTIDADFYNRDPLPDGQPVPRHTYDSLEYLPELGVLWAHGGLRAQDGVPINTTWMFDDIDGWTPRLAGPGGFNLAAAYDPVTGQVLVHTADYLRGYQVARNSWESMPGWGVTPLWPRYSSSAPKTATIDTHRRLYWSVGGHEAVVVWDIDAQMAVTDDWVTEGAGEYSNVDHVGSYADQVFTSGGANIYDANAPGLDYDPVADALVAWPNTGAPYILDLTTKVWTQGTAIGSPPAADNSPGTFGRWRYLPGYNVFMLVNSADQNVYFYKHTAGCEAP